MSRRATRAGWGNGCEGLGRLKFTFTLLIECVITWTPVAIDKLGSRRLVEGGGVGMLMPLYVYCYVCVVTQCMCGWHCLTCLSPWTCVCLSETVR
jgi:hypothetical protein